MFRGPTPVSDQAQDRGSNAGARRVVGKLLAKLKREVDRMR